MVIQRDSAAIRGEIVGAQPVLAQHDRIGRDLAHILDEAREVVSDLRIGRSEVGGGRRHGLRRAKPVHLDNIGRDRPLCGLPDKRGAEPA